MPLRTPANDGRTRARSDAPRTIEVLANPSTTARRIAPRWRIQSTRLAARTAKKATSSATLSRVSSVIASDRGAQRLEGPNAWRSDLLVLLLDHRQEEPHQIGIELRPGLALQLLDGFIDGAGRAIGPFVDDRVEGIDEADDAGAHRDPLAAEAIRVAGAVPALVVVADDGRELRRGREWLAD